MLTKKIFIRYIKNLKVKKDIIKTISVFLILTLISAFININLVHATTKNSSLNDVNPKINVEITSATPNPAMLGEDIIVSGNIIPEDFEVKDNVSEKDVILVLEISHSMIGYQLKQMKESAIDFISRLKEIPNTKVAVILYSVFADINPWVSTGRESYISEEGRKQMKNSNLKSPNEEFLDVNEYSKQLCMMIDNIETTNGYGTNTGDAIRKINYIMSGVKNKNSEKNVILMSKGTTNTCSVKTGCEEKSDIDLRGDIERCLNKQKSGKKLEEISDLKINNNYVIRYLYLIPGPLRPPTSENSSYDVGKGYAEIMANEMKNQYSPNIFTIGYALQYRDVNSTDTRTKTLQDINEYMGGNEENFFDADKDAIENIFTSIGDKVIENYTLKNIKMNLNINRSFSFHVGENKININNINYKISSRKNGKILYKAEPIPFTFKIKGNCVCKNEKLLESGSNLTFDIAENDKEKEIPISSNYKITIKDSVAANLEAKLLSATPVISNQEEDIKLTYKIKANTEEFSWNMQSGEPKDVAVLIDTSKALSDYDLKELKKYITKGILNEFSDETVIDNNIRLNIINYDQDVKQCQIDSQKRNNNGELIDYNKALEEGIDNIKASDSNTSCLGEALKIADNFINNNSRKDSKKSIIIISATNPNDKLTDKTKKSIIENKCNILSISLGKENTKLKDWHKELDGDETSYFMAKSSEDLKNNIIPDKISIKLEQINPEKTYKINNAILNFNLGKNFDLVNGLDIYEGSLSKNIPTIEYKISKNDKPSKMLTYKIDEIDDITFTIKSNEDKIGYLGFSNKVFDLPDFEKLMLPNEYTKENGLGTKEAEENIISYIDICKKNISNSIKTPIIQIKNNNDIIHHGVYQGINNIDNIPKIDESERTFAKEARVTLAANFKYNNEEKVILTINDTNNSNIVLTNNPKVYILEKSTLVPKNEIEIVKERDNKYNFNLSNSGISSGDQIVILYNEKLCNESGLYCNTIRLYNSNTLEESKPKAEKTVAVRVGDYEMPELY